MRSHTSRHVVRAHRRWAAIGSVSAGLVATAFSLFAVGGSAAVSAAPAITNYPRISMGHGGISNTWAASNWSGYAETGTYTGVSSTWTVPAVSASTSATYSSAWIGVDGFNNSDLIQTGTEEDYYSGAAHYDAWWEILPASETEISPSAYPVAPGDRMSASIYETSATTTTHGGGFGRGRGGSTEHLWDITISDTTNATKHWTFTTQQAYNGPGSSAEWIMEAPEVGGRIASLAHYTISPPANTGDFDSAGVLKTIVNSGTPTYTGAALNYTNDSGVMIQNNVQVSTPGDPDTTDTANPAAADEAYNVAYGSALPATPAG